MTYTHTEGTYKLLGLAKRIAYIEASPIRKITAILAEARKRKDIISFGGGAPSLPPAKEMVEGMRDYLAKDPQSASAYMGTRGIVDLLDLISQDLKRYGEIEVDPRRELMVTTGSTEGILLSLLATTNPGDEIIVTDPTYLGYPETIKVVGAKVVRLPVYVGEGFQPDVERFKKLITKKTKAFMFLSPDNPTGRVIRKDIAKAIVDLAVDHQFYIYCDDAYKHIIYDGEHTWLSALEGARENVITMCSFSKEAAVPGLRVGYMYGPAQIIEASEKLKQYVTLCPDTLTQLGLIRFLTGDAKERYLRWAIPIYKSRRDAMETYIHKYLPKGKMVRPNGAFYIFVDMHEYINPLKVTDEEFVVDLLRKKEVAIIPGEHFGEKGRRHCRFTFVSEPEDRIEKGVARVAEYLREAGVA